MTTGAALDLSRVNQAKVAVSVTFATNGLAFAGWFARTPAIRGDLHLSSAGFGLLLLCISAAGLGSIPISGPLVQRLGPARAVRLASTALALGLAVLGTGTLTGSVPLAGAGMVLIGMGNSNWDVAMNVEGADVERRLGRTVMPRFHAGFSLGTVIGAGVSAAAVAAGVPVWVQLYVTAVLAVVATGFVVRRFVPREPIGEGEQRPGSVRQAWREPRTLLIGLVLLGFGFTEGTANDWLTLGFVDGYHVSQTVAALGYGTFVTAMTMGRLFGVHLLERWGRVPVLRVTAVLGAAGVLLVVTGVSLAFALVGGLLWGIGASLGFPVGMSAAADDPVRAAIRVSVAGSIGYTAFLAGPPLIGLLAQHLGILTALLCALASVTVGALASGAARPLRADA